LPQFIVRQTLGVVFEGVDDGHNRPEALDKPFVCCTKNLCQEFIEKHRNLRLPVEI